MPRRRVVAACPGFGRVGPLSVCAQAFWYVAYSWGSDGPGQAPYWLKYYEGPNAPAMPGCHPLSNCPDNPDPGPWVWWNWMDKAGRWQQGEYVAPGAPMPDYAGDRRWPGQ